MFLWRERLSSLLIRGCEIDVVANTTDEYNIDSAIQTFQFAAKHDPAFLLQEMMAFGGSKMIPLSITMMYSCAPDSFLANPAVKENLHKILVDRTPAQLLECVEMLKSRAFGRGLGSRPQKAIRRAMEAWNSEDLEIFVVGQPNALYSLVRIIHPRYNQYKGEIIKTLLDGKFKK